MPRKVFLFPSPTPCPASSADGALLFYASPTPLLSTPSFFSSLVAGAVCKPAVRLPQRPHPGYPFLVREETLIITWQLLSRGKSLVWVP